MKEDKDNFDRFFSIKILKPIYPLYHEHKEILLYLFFGGCTFFVNILTFFLAYDLLHMNELIANVIAWVIGVAFAYVTNRIFVFVSEVCGVGGVLREALFFACGRLATLGMEEVMLWVGITLLGFNAILIKVIAQVAVIVGNYVISKFMVFRA